MCQAQLVTSGGFGDPEQSLDEQVGVLIEVVALDLEAADHVGTRLADGGGELVDALAGVEREGQEAGSLLPAHGGEVGDVAEGERGLADDEQSVGPRADQHDVGGVHRLQVGLADLGQAGDRPMLLLELVGDQFGRVPGVAGETLDEQCCLHRYRFKQVRPTSVKVRAPSDGPPPTAAKLAWMLDADRTPIGSAREAILTEFLKQDDLVGVDNVKIEDVLNAAHSSPSSLYHHFGSRAGLRGAARSERQRLGILEEDASLLELTASMTTPEEFADFMAAQLRRTVSDPASFIRRRERLEALVAGLRDDDIGVEAYVNLYMTMSMGQLATSSMLDVERWLDVAIPAFIAPLRP